MQYVLRCLVVTIVLVSGFGQAIAEDAPARDTSRGDAMITRYFEAETAKLAKASLSKYQSKEDWEKDKAKHREHLFEMLSLDPLPAKTPLEPVVVGTVEHEDIVVERVHFQSRPGLYVTGNFYRPKEQTGPLPAILYVCGHGRVKKGDISYGNKTHYQHHGAWFARNGYVCLTIDTVQLGEIEGIHHGTYKHGRWWWNSRGYTPAGVEAWNCIRSLDYLQSRNEVDGERIGVTGRSGGGAYSWWIAALDERIKCAVPVAGITNLQNHVVDGCVEGHCDCMFMVNTYRWDYAQVAALVAPRPLLISNTDKDRIFPLDGVVDVYSKVRRIYELYGKRDHIGLQITEGPHKDTQELRIHAFHWFNRFLKGEDSLIETAAVKFFEPEQLRVFEDLPNDELNTTIDETFVATAALPDAADVRVGNCKTAGYCKKLTELCFRGWPTRDEASNHQQVGKLAYEAEHDGIHLSAIDFSPEPNIELTLFLLRASDRKPDQLRSTILHVLDEQGWAQFSATMRVGFSKHFADSTQATADQEKEAAAFKELTGRDPGDTAWKLLGARLKDHPQGLAVVCPRGIGPTAWNQSERKQTHHRRRFMLLGQTLDGMRTWDVRHAIRTLDRVAGYENVTLWCRAEREMSGIALYATLFERSTVKRVDLYDLPKSHKDGPTFLNVLRHADIPLTVAFAAQRTKVVIYDDDAERWSLPTAIVARHTDLKGGLQIRKRP
ncbi:MAG: alpha/beta hydrolase family protein [Planctomycetales bacterium]|jgi:dienelactone hydrolase